MKDKKYRFHLIGLVHLPTSEKYMGCAFTQKNVKMAKMLLDMGHEVFVYGAEGSDVPCTEFIETHTLKDIRDAWGEGDNRFEIGYNWKIKQFKHDINSQKMPVTMKHYANAINHINSIKRPDDFLLITQGTHQKAIADAVELYLTVEPGIGYRGSFKNFGARNQLANHRGFESSYIQNFTYGSENPRASINGNYYDRVIPNYFDPKDFPFQEKKEDYFLFIGRMIIRKGVFTAVKAVDAIGGKLKLAGQLSDEFTINQLSPNCEFVGYADKEQRAELMGKAKAVFVPSIYLEPFAGVHAEAMLCGTPVITTNFGAFTDYVIDGVNGYKCDVLNDFVKAAKSVDLLDPKTIRETAEQFTLKEVSKKYQKWFDDLYQLYLSTTKPDVKGWHHIED